MGVFYGFFRRNIPKTTETYPNRVTQLLHHLLQGKIWDVNQTHINCQLKSLGEELSGPGWREVGHDVFVSAFSSESI